MIFIGPSPETMRVLGNKVAARNLAVAAGVAVMPATPAAAAGHGRVPAAGERGRLSGHAQGQLGRRRPRHARDRERRAAGRAAAGRAPRGASAAFGNDEVYLEKLVRRARHLEVQILGDSHGNLVHLYERDCTVQRRNQKVVERAPAVFLTDAERAAAVRGGAEDRPRGELPQRRHGGVPAGRGQRRGSTSSRSIRASRSSTR